MSLSRTIKNNDSLHYISKTKTHGKWKMTNKWYCWQDMYLIFSCTAAKTCIWFLVLKYLFVVSFRSNECVVDKFTCLANIWHR